MIDFEVKGAIFDVDDTLLDNARSGANIHAQSRLEATHHVGALYDVPQLQAVTLELNRKSFEDAPAHTVEAAVWMMLRKVGLVSHEVIDLEHELLQEIVVAKHAIHLELLRKHGGEIPGASSFVRRMAEEPTEGRLAIASTAIRPEVDIFLSEIAEISDLFPEHRIITKEKTIHHKPHPEAFHLAFESLDVPDGERGSVCAFEDDPRGIMAATAAGLYVCAITTRFDRASLGSLDIAPDLIADSYAEFADLFGLHVANNT